MLHTHTRICHRHWPHVAIPFHHLRRHFPGRDCNIPNINQKSTQQRWSWHILTNSDLRHLRAHEPYNNLSFQIPRSSPPSPHSAGSSSASAATTWSITDDCADSNLADATLMPQPTPSAGMWATTVTPLTRFRFGSVTQSSFPCPMASYWLKSLSFTCLVPQHTFRFGALAHQTTSNDGHYCAPWTASDLGALQLNHVTAFSCFGFANTTCNYSATTERLPIWERYQFAQVAIRWHYCFPNADSVTTGFCIPILYASPNTKQVKHCMAHRIVTWPHSQQTTSSAKTTSLVIPGD